MTNDHQSITTPRRRMSDHKLEALANSAVLKLVQSAVTVIVIPLAAWVGLTVLDRLNTIEKTIQAGQITNATMELRVKALEDQSTQLKAAERLLLIETELRLAKGAGRP